MINPPRPPIAPPPTVSSIMIFYLKYLTAFKGQKLATHRSFLYTRHLCLIVFHGVKIAAGVGKILAAAVTASAISSSTPQDAHAFGPIKMSLTDPEYKEVTCPPKTQVPLASN